MLVLGKKDSDDSADHGDDDLPSARLHSDESTYNCQGDEDPLAYPRAALLLLGQPFTTISSLFLNKILPVGSW